MGSFVDGIVTGAVITGAVIFVSYLFFNAFFMPPLDVALLERCRAEFPKAVYTNKVREQCQEDLALQLVELMNTLEVKKD